MRTLDTFKHLQYTIIMEDDNQHLKITTRYNIQIVGIVAENDPLVAHVDESISSTLVGSLLS